MEKPDALNDSQLTASQTAASQDLKFFFDLHREGIRSVAGVKTRPFPLLVAPSGAGKTYLVQQLGRAAEIPVYSINIQNWIIRAARSEQHTLSQIAKFVESNSSGIIFLDEVNKLSRQHAAESSWVADLFSELIAFLDADSRLEVMGFAGSLQHLQRNFFVVGAGAFQDQWEESLSNSAIGFVESDRTSSGERFESLVRNQNVVPAELLYRFNDQLILIQPPSAAEYRARIDEIRARLELPSLNEQAMDPLVENALQSGKAMRWLEGYTVGCLREIPRGLERGAALPENSSASVAPISANLVTASRASETDPRTVGAYIEAYNNYLKSLSALARNAGRLEFSFAELWHRAATDDSLLNASVVKLLEQATAELRRRSHHDRASLVVYLRWLSKNALTVQPAASDTDRAKVANKLLDVSTALEESLSPLSGRLHAGMVSPSTRISMVEFVLSVRESRNAFERLSAVLP